MERAHYSKYLLLVLCGLWLPIVTARGETETLTPKQLADYAPDSALLGEKVRTRGTVIWVNPFWHACFIAQESDSQGVMLELLNQLDYMKLEVGREIVAEGVLVQTEHANLDSVAFRTVGPGKRPTPLSISGNLQFDALSKLDRHYVTIEGKVRFSTQHFDRYVLWIEGYGIDVCAEFEEREKHTIGLNYAGATVKVTGVARLADGGDSKLKLSVQSAKDVEVLKPGPLWPADKGGRGINGVIVCRKSDNYYFFRADDKEFIELDIFDCQFLTVGDIARFVGTEFEEHNGIRRVHVAGLEVHQSPNDWTLDTGEPTAMGVAEKHHTGDWTLVKGVPSANIVEELQEGWLGLVNPHGETIRVEIAALVGDTETLQLSTATHIEAVGYLDLEPQGAVLYPRDLKDLKVIDRLPWYRSTRVQGLLIGLLSTLAVSLVAVAFLRKAVKRGIRSLEESTGLLNASYDAILEGICLVDAEEAIQRANPHFWQLLDLEPDSVRGMRGEVLRDHLADCFIESAEFARLWDSPSNVDQERQEHCFNCKAGPAEQLSVYSVDAHTQGWKEKLGRVWVFHDLTEQRRLEQSLLQAQKMEAVGRLAGGIAHDFNNMLAGISGNLELAKQKLDQQPEQSTSFVEAAEYGVGRAAQLVKGLLGFSRQSNLEVKPGSVNEVVKTLLNLLVPTLDPKLVLKADLASGLDYAKIDAVQLEQVLLNLIVNARDAMLPVGGTICIQTRNVLAAENAGEAAEDCIRISVTDTGTGMTPEVIAHVFEPFFSTKQLGQGTGLGLATSLGVIQQLNGWITCDSELGQGTAFRIFLPRLSADVLPLDVPRTPLVGLTKIDSSICVLCVDDEEFVRKSAEAMLNAMGYQTWAAENGEQALEILADATAAGEKLPDVVMLDQAMPQLSGVETLPILREFYPEMPVVLCSGFLADLEEFAEKAGSRPDGFVQKPYLGHQLNSVLEQVVGDSQRLADSTATMPSNRATR